MASDGPGDMAPSAQIDSTASHVDRFTGADK
jgi:hypothetical protein